jgi:preprotein translocase subunit SecE
MASIVRFIREVRQETGKVTWPNRRETVQATIMVLAMVALCTAFFLFTDTILAFVMKTILGFGS